MTGFFRAGFFPYKIPPLGHFPANIFPAGSFPARLLSARPISLLFFPCGFLNKEMN